MGTIQNLSACTENLPPISINWLAPGRSAKEQQGQENNSSKLVTYPNNQLSAEN